MGRGAPGRGQQMLALSAIAVTYSGGSGCQYCSAELAQGWHRISPPGV